MTSPPPSPPPEPATITVLGTAVLRTEPDEAILWIRLSALDDSPGRALAGVAERSERLVGLLDGSLVPTSDRSTTGIRIEEEFDHTKDGRRSLGHRATAAFAVRLSDSDLIGLLITRVSADVLAGVDGPHCPSQTHIQLASTQRARPQPTPNEGLRRTQKASAQAWAGWSVSPSPAPRVQ